MEGDNAPRKVDGKHQHQLIGGERGQMRKSSTGVNRVAGPWLSARYLPVPGLLLHRRTYRGGQTIRQCRLPGCSDILQYIWFLSGQSEWILLDCYQGFPSGVQSIEWSVHITWRTGLVKRIGILTADSMIRHAESRSPSRYSKHGRARSFKPPSVYK